MGFFYFIFFLSLWRESKSCDKRFFSIQHFIYHARLCLFGDEINTKQTLWMFCLQRSVGANSIRYVLHLVEGKSRSASAFMYVILIRFHIHTSCTTKRISVLTGKTDPIVNKTLTFQIREMEFVIKRNNFHKFRQWHFYKKIYIFFLLPLIRTNPANFDPEWLIQLPNTVFYLLQ